MNVFNGKDYSTFENNDDDFSGLKQEEQFEQIIIHGLQKLNIHHFIDEENNHKHEDSIGFSWALHLSRLLLTMYISPQTYTTSSKGKEGRIDFILNGSYDLALECSKNHCGLDVGKGDVKKEDRLSKFQNSDGVYFHWCDRFAILNFQITQNEILQLNDDQRVYHFLLSENSLYRGQKLIKKNVCKQLYSKEQ